MSSEKSSNTAEGAGGNTNKDFRRFLSIAYDSSYELKTQIIISLNLKYIGSLKNNALCKEITEIQKMIYTLSKRLERS